MWHHRRTSIKAVKAAERRQREDSAPRLQQSVPALESLAIQFHEVYGDNSLAEGTHIRRIVVANAPAHFEIPCASRDCEGVHDLTLMLLNELLEAHREFGGEHCCDGGEQHKDCGRTLRWSAVADYA
jgi:hypothetical protein